MDVGVSLIVVESFRYGILRGLGVNRGGKERSPGSEVQNPGVTWHLNIDSHVMKRKAVSLSHSSTLVATWNR